MMMDFAQTEQTNKKTRKETNKQTRPDEYDGWWTNRSSSGCTHHPCLVDQSQMGVVDGRVPIRKRQIMLLAKAREESNADEISQEKLILGIRIRPDELKKGVTMRGAGVGKAVTA